MTRKQKTQRIIGIILLVTLILPVIVLSIPATYTEIVFYTNPASGLVESEYNEITYTPLVELLRAVDGTFGDISFLVVYAGLFALAVWLIVHSARRRLKDRG